MKPTREALAIATEHVRWSLAAGQSPVDVALALGMRRFIWPSEEDLIERTATVWMRFTMIQLKAAA